MSTSTASVTDRLAARVSAVSLAACEVVEELIASRSEVRTVAGLSVEVWLTCHTHLTRTERRAFQVAADTLPSLPGVRAAFAAGRLSWHLVRSITRAATRLDTAQRAVLDARLTVAMSTLADVDPTTLLDVLDAAMDDLREDLLRDAERRRTEGEYLHVQPALDGLGGTMNGRWNAPNFAALMEFLDAHTEAPELQANPHGDPQITWDNRRALAHARATGLLTALGATTTRPAAAPSAQTAPSTPTAPSAPSRPKLLATVDLETLLGLNRRAGRLLTTLLGGQLRVSAKAARRIAQDPAGVDFRLIVTDGADVVGVGRSRRHAPDWLRDAVLALHPTCSRPDCDRAARQGDLDHLQAWEHGGRTDADNLRPLCRSHHTAKGTGRNPRWTAHADTEGGTVWTNRLTGDRLVQPSLPHLRDLGEGRRPT